MGFDEPSTARAQITPRTRLHAPRSAATPHSPPLTATPHSPPRPTHRAAPFPPWQASYLRVGDLLRGRCLQLADLANGSSDGGNDGGERANEERGNEEGGDGDAPTSAACTPTAFSVDCLFRARLAIEHNVPWRRYGDGTPARAPPVARLCARAAKAKKARHNGTAAEAAAVRVVCL